MVFKMPGRITPELCVKCKGVRRLCGKPVCPILLRFKASVRTLSQIKIEGDNIVFGPTPPTLIVGEGGYPEVNVYSGIAPVDEGDAKIFDNPVEWWGKLSLKGIVELRSSLLLPRAKYRITIAKYFNYPSSFHELQLASVSLRPIDTEVKLKKKPLPILRFDGLLAPLGPTAPFQKLRVIGNPKLTKVVERVIYDTDLKALNAVIELYTKGVSIYDIIRIFSAGLLGRLNERKLVPTRWSITAVDVIVGNKLVKEIRNNQPISEILLYNVTYLRNHFEILLLPSIYSFEMIEIWLPSTPWTATSMKPIIIENYELWDAKLRGEMDGGYYALRLGVLENLYKIKRQASIVAIREIRPDYYAPVGNWHIRESARKAFLKKPEKFATVEEALESMRTRLKTPVEYIVKKSILLRNMLRQGKIIDYFK